MLVWRGVILGVRFWDILGKCIEKKGIMSGLVINKRIIGI